MFICGIFYSYILHGVFSFPISCDYFLLHCPKHISQYFHCTFECIFPISFWPFGQSSMMILHFLFIYNHTMLSLECSTSYMVINFLLCWCIDLSFSFVQLSNSSMYLTNNTTQEFIHLIKFCYLLQFLVYFLSFWDVIFLSIAALYV